MCAVGNKDPAFPVDALILEHLKLLHKGFRVNDHACTKVNFLFRVQDSARYLMERELLAVHDNGVTCVGTACIADNVFCVFCKVVNDFSLTFIAPLGTDNYDFHIILRSGLGAATIGIPGNTSFRTILISLQCCTPGNLQRSIPRRHGCGLLSPD